MEKQKPKLVVAYVPSIQRSIRSRVMLDYFERMGFEIEYRDIHVTLIGTMVNTVVIDDIVEPL